MPNYSSAQLLLLQAPRQLAWVCEPLPDLGPHDLLPHTRTGAISLGTELPLYLGKSRGVHQPEYPFMTGYETVAEVIACGPAVQSVSVGDRVVAFYGHRTAAVVPEARVVPIPPSVPDMLAVLLILACDTAKGLSKVALHAQSRVVITASGTIGLLTLFNRHARGLRDIVVIDPVAHRRTVAQTFGARTAFAPDGKSIYEQSCDIGFECSSRDSAFHLLQDLVEPNGPLCILADGNLEPLTLTPAFHAKELTVVGSSDGLDYRSYAIWLWEIAQSGRYPLTSVFEQTADAETLPVTFEQLAASNMRPFKVFVQYE